VKSPESSFLVKRISYLACDDTDTFIPSCASRFTRKRSGSAIVAEDSISYDPAIWGRLCGSPKTRGDSLPFEDKETRPRSSRYTLSAA
jgi:hypothetical protein